MSNDDSTFRWVIVLRVEAPTCSSLWMGLFEFWNHAEKCTFLSIFRAKRSLWFRILSCSYKSWNSRFLVKPTRTAPSMITRFFDRYFLEWQFSWFCKAKIGYFSRKDIFYERYQFEFSLWWTDWVTPSIRCWMSDVIISAYASLRKWT